MIEGRHRRTLTALVILVLAAFGATPAVAQSDGGPLTTQGLNQQPNHSAASRAFGGVTFGRESNVGLMFDNPAAMQGLDGIRLSIAGYRQYQDREQVQQFAPVRYYPNLSLLLENRTDGIPDPDTSLIGFSPADTVQRPFDDIPPSWSRSTTNDVPLHALVAVPFSLGGVALTAGVGAVRYAVLDHYYQNNNVLSPRILEQRPLPTLRPTDDDPITAEWYQAVRSREGAINGYGAALAAHFERYNLTVGVSGMLLDGQSDDVEERLNRGELTFLSNEFRADSSVGFVRGVGTSEYSAQQFTLSSTLHSQYVDLNVVVKPPTTFERTYEMDVEGDTAGAAFTASVSGTDEFQLPWRGSAGLLLKPTDRLEVGLEYELRPYADATFTDSDGDETSPWQSASLFRIGTEYQLASWLVLRGGIRGEADVFMPDGSAFEDDPVNYRVFTAGVGIDLFGAQWNVTYENADMKYEDVWGSALSRNEDVRHRIVTSLTYTIPGVP